ncbi:hypothetical protein [Pseudomonas sp. TH10]|uniref:hypothetical protein n=1 Tax=Pseudomonas sp. TH10 TaxID=2796376 RepID=UPI001913E0B3|nr:hypothetical protein [Pseudomonas sp. TH10]MBK5519382.1 hypothetical protein [Pseudomonas sp. TH10]
MIAVNATSLRHTAGAIELPMSSAPQPCTALSLGLLTTGNGSGKEASAFSRVARIASSQPVPPFFETSAASQAEAANLWQRVQNYFSPETALGEFVTEWTQGAKANTHRAALEKAILHFYVNQRLMAQGVNAEDLHDPIDGLVEKMLVVFPALDFVKVVQGLVEKIQRGHQTPQTVIERFPVKDYVAQRNISKQPRRSPRAGNKRWKPWFVYWNLDDAIDALRRDSQESRRQIHGGAADQPADPGSWAAGFGCARVRVFTPVARLWRGTDKGRSAHDDYEYTTDECVRTVGGYGRRNVDLCL